MTMLAEQLDAVIGVDTHRDTHTLELAASTGAPIAALTVTNDSSGYVAALRWAAEHAPGPRLLFAVEGTRSYGAGLARAIAAAGLVVIEVERPRVAGRRRGKSDALDAHAAVLAALRTPADRVASPRVDGPREALRILLGAREEMTSAKTAQINRLRALLLTGEDTDRPLARGRLTVERLQMIARRRGRPDDAVDCAVRRAEARRLAISIRYLAQQLADNKVQLTRTAEQVAPGLISRVGIGPVSAAQAVVSWSHHGRCRNDAAFAALAGTCPIPASSGRTVRHRLNRGGDRALNRATHDIAKTRMQHCPRTRDYIARRTAEGKTPREIRRCLKRYITRELYRALQATPAS
ncbi:MAG: IS110 family transposase [Mycobacteriales bacterium]